MYKENGDYRNSNAYKNASKSPTQAPFLSSAKMSGNSLVGDESIIAKNAKQNQTPSKFELDEWDGKVTPEKHADFIDDAVETLERREMFAPELFYTSRKGYNGVNTSEQALKRLDELETQNAYPQEAIEILRKRYADDNSLWLN